MLPRNETICPKNSRRKSRYFRSGVRSINIAESCLSRAVDRVMREMPRRFHEREPWVLALDRVARGPAAADHRDARLLRDGPQILKALLDRRPGSVVV